MHVIKHFTLSMADMQHAFCVLWKYKDYVCSNEKRIGEKTVFYQAFLKVSGRKSYDTL